VPGVKYKELWIGVYIVLCSLVPRMMAQSTAVLNVDIAEQISLVQHPVELLVVVKLDVLAVEAALMAPDCVSIEVELLVVVKLDVSAVEAALMAPDCVSIEVENLNLGSPCKVRYTGGLSNQQQ
jgi:hypothetical protein